MKVTFPPTYTHVAAVGGSVRSVGAAPSLYLSPSLPLAAMFAAPSLTLLLLLVAAVTATTGFLTEANADAGTVIPAESRPCVDCHAFEFMQRALQDLKRTANNLNTRTNDLLLRVEKRALCDCLLSNL